jgi:arylsulfatase A-like enzyme
VAAVTSDFVPTLAGIVKAEMTVHPIDGISLLPVFAGAMDERPKPIGFASQGQAAWHEGRYKLSRNGKKPWALYDLEADPTESNDIAADMPERVETMSAAYDSWMHSCRASEDGEDYQP